MKKVIKSAIIFILLGILPPHAWCAGSALPDSPNKETLPEDSLFSPTLGLNIEALAFFADNEWDGDIVKGYTLPGAWLRPRLTYDPLRAIHLELGLHALFYSGADRYPNYAFHDIANWHGSSYQRVYHILPWFRADATVGSMRFTLGNLHHRLQQGLDPGAGRGGLTLPLYNAECDLSADPEQGAQIYISRPRYTLDAWIDWQSFIFRMDTHQEAFTVGISQDIALTPRRPEGFTLSMPLQVLAQHRGGEIDDTDTGVQTLGNAAAGLRALWLKPHNTLSRITLEGYWLGALQKDGQLWPFDMGHALWIGASLEWWKRLETQVGLFHAADFVSLYGNPHFSTLSLKYDGRFSHMTTGLYSVKYTHPFGQNFSLSAFLNGYICGTGRLSMPDPKSPMKPAKMITQPAAVNHSFSFGATFSADMNFLLKKFSQHH